MRVTALAIHPIKSCRALPVDGAKVGLRGFVDDRRWMIVDEKGQFVSQRSRPRLALVTCTLEGDRIHIQVPWAGSFSLPRTHHDGARMNVTVWSSHCEAIEHEDASHWFSEAFGARCHLVFMPDDVERQVEDSAPGEIVSFADGYPFLLTTQTSLDALNGQLEEPVGMSRFRPNIVVDGEAPFAEEEWRRIKVGDVEFRNAKGCERCTVITVDPETGVKGIEPLRTLARFHRRDHKVWFGINLIAEGTGTVRVGDPVVRLD